MSSAHDDEERGILPPSYDSAVGSPAVVIAPYSDEPVKTKMDVSADSRPQVVQYVLAPEVPASEVPDNLLMAILATVFCCVPFGIVAIVKASECKAQRARGDRQAALSYSASARKWSLAAILVGTIFTLLVGAVYATYIAQLIDEFNQN